MTVTTNRLDRVNLADSPEGFTEATVELLEALADDADESGMNCEHNWQDKGAGRPWREIAKRLRRNAASLKGAQ